MMVPSRQEAPPRARLLLMLAGVVLAAFNLRAPIAAISPLLPRIQTDLGLSRGIAGALTALPVLCFGLLSAPAASLGRRIGDERALVLSLFAMAAGSALRVISPQAAFLFGGTILMGGAITAGNVLVPSIIKEHWGRRHGAVTGLYTAFILGGATVGSAISAPLSKSFGWQGSLSVWIAPELLAALLWVPWLRGARGAITGQASPSLLGNRTTWGIALFMGSQSLTYFAILAWLPALLQEQGVSDAQAGAALALFSLLGIATALIMPALAARSSDQRALALLVCAGWAIGIGGLWLAPGAYFIWTCVAGFSQGAAISLAFALIVLRARTPEVARALSGTVQSIGYCIGALGPLALGAIRDVSRSWSVSLMVLLGVVGLMAAGAWRGARPGTVG